MQHSIVLNGKFLSGPATGVQRVAAELIKALDNILTSKHAPGDLRFELLTPYNSPSQLKLKMITTSESGHFKGIPWEQFDLPRLAKGRLVVNLANLGPIFKSRAITLIHDAQTFSSPSSYGIGFRHWYGIMQPVLGRINQRILTVSEFSKHELVKYGVATADKIDVVHNGVDHVLAVPKNETTLSHFRLTPRQYVLGLANDQPHKNIKLLIRAFESNKLKDLELVLFGYSNKDALEKVYGGHLPTNVNVVGIIDDGELRTLMESALCLGFPSTTEGFGLPPLEAMRLGCPAIVSPCGALPEVCGSAALYADPNDPEVWVTDITRLAENPGEWSKLSLAGIAHASPFRWERAAARLIDILYKYR